MKNDIFLVEENLNEFAKRGRKPKLRMRNIEGGDTDKWGSEEEDDAELAGPEEIEDITIEDEVGNPNVALGKTLDHELGTPEFSRAFVKFKILGTGEKVKGIPMAKLGGGSAYLFKTASGLKKVKLTDMIVESLNEDSNDPYTNYIFDIETEIKTEYPEWDLLLGEDADLLAWIEDGCITPLSQYPLDFADMMKQGFDAEDAASEAMMRLDSIQNPEEESEEEY